MTLSAIFRWKHPDSTLDMNKRLQTLVPRGIFDGGEVTAGSGLTVLVSPGIAIGYDGMLVQDDAVQTLGVVANQTNYIVVRAKYVSGSTPTVQWEVMTQAAYNADPDKNYLIVYAVVTLALGVTTVALADISTLARDTVDPLTRSPYRGNTVHASLPTHPPVQNRDGDFYFLTDLGTFYWWNAATSTWDAFTTGSYNVETGSMQDVVIQGERDRQLNGSGILGGKRPADGFASELDIELVETPSVADQIGFNTFSATVNGHYVQPYARYVTLAAKPATTRYDLVFLEVYREAITVPENHAFPRNPDGTSTYTITQVSDQVEQMLWEAGVGGNNFDLNELQQDDHLWTVTKYRIGTVSGVTTTSLQDNQAAAALATNVDGNAFAAPSGPAPGTDERTWIATSTTAQDGFSWAIPLFVVKRTVAEDHTIGQAVQIYRDDIRWVFPVYPVADTEQAARLSVDTIAREQPFNYATETQVDYTKPSGFINGFDYEIGPGVGSRTVKFYEDEIRFRLRGLEDTLRFTGGPDFQLGASPATGYERGIVYLKLCYTMYHNDPTQVGTMISKQHRPLITDQVVIGYPFKGIGWKRGYVTYEMVEYNLWAAATELDEHDSMVTAGWTKGDASMAALGQQYSDGGIWSKSASVSTDERVPIFGREWAIPVCLIHRRNKATWDWSTNPNGTGSARPDGKTSADTFHQDDLLDLRRQVDVDEARLAEMLESDIDRLLRGQLRTRMAERWAGTAGVGGAVAGTRLLQSDHTDIGGASAAFKLDGPTGSKKIWSDAQEFIPVATSFPLDANFNDDYVQWTVATGQLIVKSPQGTHLLRNLPSEFLVDGDSSNATYLQFDGEPLWSTQQIFGLGYPIFTRLKWIDSVTGDHEEQNVFDNLYGTQLEGTANPAFSVTASDTLGHATQMTITLTDVIGYASADRLMVSFWVHAPRNTTGSEYVSYGLAEVPDIVHAIYKNPTGVQEAINCGVLYTTVRTTVAASTDVVITSADVLAASGTSGTTATIVGFDRTTIAYDTAPGAAFTSATLDAPQTTLTITHSGAITADVDTVVYYYTDTVTEWVEVGRGGKSVRAYYSWFEDDVDLGAVPASSYASDLLTGVWSFAEVSGGMLEMPVVWESATGTSGPWTYVVPAASPFAGYQYSNMISIDVSASVSQRYIKLVAPIWVPPAASAADEFICHYSATPYNGLSSTGGAVAATATALPKLKKMLHGTIEANSPHVVTQAGATSIFGGVNSWTGAQSRFPQQDLNFNGGRFRSYNQTHLVKPTKATGSIDFTGADPQAMYAGAVMRLPYPANPAMLEGGIYSKSVMEWDLDPGREGVGSGYMCQAPGYQNDLSRLNLTNGLHLDQFVNGLTRLSLGSSIRQDTSVLAPAASLRMDNSSSGTIEYDATIHSWVFQASEDVIGDVPISSSRGMVPLLVTTALGGIFAGDLVTPFGVAFYSPTALIAAGPATWFTASMPEYNSPVTLDGTNPVLACVVPGSASLYHRFASQDVYPVIHVDVQATADIGDRSIGQSFVIQDGPQQHVPSPQGLAYDSSRVVDTVYLPFGSSSYSNTNHAEPDSVASASLRGRVVQYPASWGATTTTALEALIQPSKIFRSDYGRGLFMGTSTTMYTMPMMLPGSGEPVFSLLQREDTLVEKTAQPAEQFPTSSAVSPFNHSVRENIRYDHGGPIAYSCYGTIISPADDDYSGMAVMQISGGPMGPRSYIGSSVPTRIGDDLAASALDCFWPSKRPLLRAK